MLVTCLVIRNNKHLTKNHQRFSEENKFRLLTSKNGGAWGSRDVGIPHKS